MPWYQAAHPPIIDRVLWDNGHTILATNGRVCGNALPNHITLFDLAVDPPALWDEQRARMGHTRKAD